MMTRRRRFAQPEMTSPESRWQDAMVARRVVAAMSSAAAASAAAYHAVLEEAAPLLRAGRGLLRALQQAREAIPADRDLISARDRAAAIARSAELIVQDARFGMDFTAARNAERHAENSRRHLAAAATTATRPPPPPASPLPAQAPATSSTASPKSSAW